MKVKKYILGLSILATVIAGSFFVSQLTKLSAQNRIRRLEGVVIVLDAGHGGRDDGARSGNIKEDEINLSITKKTKQLLSDAGARVILTRDRDSDLASEGVPSRKKDDMKKRVDIMNEDDVDIFLSIHLNAYSNTSAKGAVTFYQKENETSRAFAQIVQKHMKVLTGSKMLMKPGDYYVLNNTKKTGILVECGFLSNASDRALLVQDDYQNKLAKTLYNSICEYFNFLM